jgi:hypothetical protein
MLQLQFGITPSRSRPLQEESTGDRYSCERTVQNQLSFGLQNSEDRPEM